MQVGENSGEDETVSVDLNSLFKDLTFDAAVEVALAAGQPLSKVGSLDNLPACDLLFGHPSILLHSKSTHN